MRTLILIGLVAFQAMSMGSKSPKNLGHRLGSGDGEYHSSIPENSLSALRAAALGVNGETPIQYREDFLYYEFDVQETYDGELVLFHDSKLTRMLPDLGANADVYDELINSPEIQDRIGDNNLKAKDLRVRHLTLEELQRLSLKDSNGEPVPTLDEFLYYAELYQVVKPVVSEIKLFVTDAGRLAFIDKMAGFRDGIDVSRVVFEEGYDMSMDGVALLSFKGNFKNSFGDSKSDRQYWCDIIRANGFSKVYKARGHSTDVCNI